MTPLALRRASGIKPELTMCRVVPTIEAGANRLLANQFFP